MAHNFRKTGNIYVSKAGSDASNGLTPDTPKLTVTAGIGAVPAAGKVIIGTGVYKEAVLFSGKNCELIADGLVVFQGTPSDNITINSVNGTIVFDNITISGYGAIAGNNNSVLVRFINKSIVRDTDFTHVNGGATNIEFNKAVWINGENLSTPGSTSLNLLYDSKLINCAMIGVRACKNTYVNQASSISCLAAITPSDFNYNNIRGNIIMNTGVNPTNDGLSKTLAAHKTAYPTYNTRSFAADPRFNNVNKQDFSLKIDSPHFNTTDIALSNIGASDFGQSYYTSSNELKVSGGAVWTNVEQVLGDIKVLAGQTVGTLTTAALSVAGYVAEITILDYVGALTFNKSFSGGTVENSQVPDTNTYINANGSGFGNPDRLVVEGRWSTQETAPTLDAHWDNQQYVTAGNYSLFEWNEKPMIDTTGKGNGDPAFNVVNAAPVAARWMQLRITLRQNYSAA